jgi:hypothetical protein
VPLDIAGRTPAEYGWPLIDAANPSWRDELMWRKEDCGCID